MKTVDLKLPKKDAELREKSVPLSEQNRWPWGMRLTFESEQVDKLPRLKEYKIGQRVAIEGIGEITEVRMREEKDGSEKYTVEVQLHEVGCEAKAKGTGSMLDDMARIKQSRRM